MMCVFLFFMFAPRGHCFVISRDVARRASKAVLGGLIACVRMRNKGVLGVNRRKVERWMYYLPLAHFRCFVRGGVF